MVETSEQTIARTVGAYDIGRKLRDLRLRKKVALTDLARHTGLSPSMLSQLETGKLIPTLPTLARISMVFDVGLEHFFGARREKPRFALVRREERIKFPERPDKPQPSYFFECLSFAAQGKAFEAYVAEFPGQDHRNLEAHQHQGAEFVYVLEGSLAIRFDAEEHVLEAGDSAYFESIEPHSYRGVGSDGAKALVVTSPPRM